MHLVSVLIPACATEDQADMGTLKHYYHHTHRSDIECLTHHIHHHISITPEWTLWSSHLGFAFSNQNVCDVLVMCLIVLCCTTICLSALRCSKSKF